MLLAQKSYACSRAYYHSIYIGGLIIAADISLLIGESPLAPYYYLIILQAPSFIEIVNVKIERFAG